MAEASPTMNAKGELQELFMARNQPVPSYDEATTQGPPHMTTFTTVVRHVSWEGRSFCGQGATKKAAERAAAAAALAYIRQPAAAAAAAPAVPAPPSPSPPSLQWPCHINPEDISKCLRVILIDLDSTQSEVFSTIAPNPGTFIMGFISRRSKLDTRTAAFPVKIVASDLPDSVDVAIIWTLAKLVYREFLPPTAEVTIISDDEFKDPVPAVVADLTTGRVAVRAVTWDTFVAGGRAA